MEPRLDVNLEVLARYLTGIASPEERADIDGWIGNSPERRHWITAVQSSMVVPTPSTLDIQALDARVRSVIEATDFENRRGAAKESQWELGSSRRVAVELDPIVATPLVVETPYTGDLQPRLRPGVRRWQGIQLRPVFVAIVLPVLAPLMWITSDFRRSGVDGGLEQTYTYTTTRGQTTTVFLGDGTRALMAPGSQLTYYENGAERQVTLIGSAYFTVAQSDAKPFSVRTSQAVTSVLGTEFTVRAYADELNETVLVRSGRVTVRSSTQSVSQAVVVAAGQQAQVDVARTTTIAPTPIYAFSWVDGVLRFTNARVSDAVREIGRWYDLDIRVDDPIIASMHLNASFKQKSAEQVVQYLSVVLGVEVQWEGRVVTFSR